MPDLDQQIGFAKMVRLFLAEVLRSRRVSLGRAAEISRRVIKNMDNIKSETDALNMLSEIEKDFEEVGVLKQALHFGYQQSEIKLYEQEIKEFASELLKQDLQASANFLRDSSAKDANIQVLCVKYPRFCEYLSNSTDKSSAFAMAGQLPPLNQAVSQ